MSYVAHFFFSFIYFIELFSRISVVFGGTCKNIFVPISVKPIRNPFTCISIEIENYKDCVLCIYLSQNVYNGILFHVKIHCLNSASLGFSPSFGVSIREFLIDFAEIRVKIF